MERWFAALTTKQLRSGVEHFDNVMVGYVLTDNAGYEVRPASSSRTVFSRNKV